ncbi:hypothetical protein V1477_011066, partial [Vespula maculifrons]
YTGKEKRINRTKILSYFLNLVSRGEESVRFVRGKRDREEGKKKRKKRKKKGRIGGEERRRVEEVKEDEEERGRRRHRLEDGPRYSGCSCRLLTECLQAGAGKEGFRFE